MSDAEPLCPPGWSIHLIEELFAPLEDGRTLHQGWSPQCEREPSASEKTWGVLKTTAIQPGEFQPEHNKLLPSNQSPRPAIEVKEGDLLITCAGPRVRCGVACLVRKTRKRLMMSGKMYRFRVNPERTDPRYLEAFLQTEQARRSIDKMKTGISDSGLNLTHNRFRQLLVPVAPLTEQARIVTAIEQQFTLLEAGITALRQVQAKLRRYRSAILKTACEGRLVPTEAELARRAGRPCEPSSEFLARIFTERRNHWLGRGKYKEPSLDASELSALPLGWAWVSTETIAFVTKLAGFEYTKYVKYSPTGDLAVIKAENAGRGGFKSTEISRIDSSSVAHLTRTQLQAGDVLMVFVGAGTGNVASVPNDQSYFLGPNIAMIRVNSRDVLGRYLELFLRSPIGSALTSRFIKAVAQPSLSMGTIRMIPVALPPLAEQTRIVAEIERRLSVVEKLEVVVNANLKRAFRLRQTILKRAFSGV